MVIMITGEKNIGKTTIMRKIYDVYYENVSGFCTKEFFENEIRQGFFISELETETVPCKENIIAKMDGDFKPIVYPDIFDEFGVNIAKKCLNSAKSIIIIDEIGVFESKSEKFVKILDEILSSDKIVIAVLKKRQHIFLEKYEKLYNPIEITLLNRNKIAKDILNIIRENL